VLPARLAADDAIRPEPARLPPPWPGRFVELADPVGRTPLRLHLRETPTTSDGAEPALYVHGLGGSAQNWTDLAYLLADRFEGQAIDMPGFGHSGPPGAGGYGQAASAAVVARWIETAGRGPVHLIGNSLGGAVTVRVAASRPDLVRTLTLISPAMPVFRPLPAHHRMLPVLAVPRVERFVERFLLEATPLEMTQGMVDMCFGDPAAVADQRWDEAIAEAEHRRSVPWGAAAYVGALRGLVGSYLRPPRSSLWRLASRIQVPTLVIWGDRDKLVDVRLARRTAKAIPGSQLLVLRGVGHTAQLETPRIVARAVVGLLNSSHRGPTVRAAG
jgi:pimeloyl-ACP methyl ester carboxylesterase